MAALARERGRGGSSEWVDKRRSGRPLGPARSGRRWALSGLRLCTAPLSLDILLTEKNRERPKESREEAMEKNTMVGYFCKALWNVSNPTRVVPAK